MIFVGIDWSEQHHDIEVQDPDGGVLASARVVDGVDGIGRLHALIGDHADDAGEVIVGIEIDRGLLVGSLIAAGYEVFAVNPKSVDRYRDRHHLSGAKSDAGDAKVLADLVRTDRHNHRPVAGDSDLAEATKLTARAHHSLIWTRQRQANTLRSALREYYPGALAAFGTDLADRDAVAVLTKSTHARAGAAPVDRADRLGAAARRPPAQHRRARGGDPRCAARAATRRSPAGR